MKKTQFPWKDELPELRRFVMDPLKSRPIKTHGPIILIVIDIFLNGPCANGKGGVHNVDELAQISG